MIQVPEDIARALRAKTIRKKLRVTWTFTNGHVIDLSDKVVSIGAVLRSLKPLMGGYRVSGTTVRVANVAREFSPNSSSSRLGNFGNEDYIDSDLVIEQAVWGESTGWHYFPVYAGFVEDLSYGGGIMEMRIGDKLARLLRIELPDEIALNPEDSAGLHVQNLITSYTRLTTADLDTASFNYAKFQQDDIGWQIIGNIPGGTPLGEAASAVARSGMSVLFPLEDGRLSLTSEWPRAWGLNNRPVDSLPDVIDPTSAGKFKFRRGANQIASEIVVKYQEVSAAYINAAQETALGFRSSKTVEMPYCAFQYQAAWAARFIWEMLGGYLDIMQFVTPGVGLQLQLNDRITVQSDQDDDPVVYRVASKKWTRTWMAIEAVKDSHLTSIVDGTFAVEGTTAYGSGTELAL